MNVIDKKLKHIQYLYNKRLLYENMLQEYLNDKNFYLMLAMSKQSAMAIQQAIPDDYKESPHKDAGTIKMECCNLEDIEGEFQRIEKIILCSKKNQIHIEGLQKQINAWVDAKNQLMNQLYQQYIPCDEDLKPFHQINMNYKKDVQKRLGELKISSPNQNSQI